MRGEEKKIKGGKGKEAKMRKRKEIQIGKETGGRDVGREGFMGRRHGKGRRYEKETRERKEIREGDMGRVGGGGR